jgi:hypothetical protein
MFDNAEIGVPDKNGNPIHCGDTVKVDMPGYDKEYKVIYDQETCSFLLQEQGLSYRLVVPILNYVMSSHYIVLY